ncbi:hypothetical protein [Burkholderia metallica]|uniref:Uncharacterized protein n=1 Tax=Burkholderia metallica TaxID=488729 RepID=A0ABT8PAC4_9BURK|nr:hypothetical protein [Burkholderia metallica]MCA7999058.1 hypothetical protein [Burkholderia metallica]MDN7931911.1 hypothetical protein [Burkholderia metallica]
MCPQTRTTPSFFKRILPSRPNRAAGKSSSRNRAFGAYRPPYRHFAEHNGPAASGIFKNFSSISMTYNETTSKENFEFIAISH